MKQRMRFAIISFSIFVPFFKGLLGTFKRNKNAALFQWKIHGLWFEVLDKDNVPSCFQGTLKNSTTQLNSTQLY